MAKERNKTIRVQAVQFLRLKTVAKGKKTMPLLNASTTTTTTTIFVEFPVSGGKGGKLGDFDLKTKNVLDPKIEYPKKATKNATTSTNHAQQ